MKSYRYTRSRLKEDAELYYDDDDADNDDGNDYNNNLSLIRQT